MSNELLRLENLSVDYRISAGYLSAVNNVSFAINKGEIFALVGESGCGKSTVAHTIMRLSIDHNEILSGKIMFEDRDLLSISEAEMEKVRGKQIGMVFQNPLDSLNPVYRSGTQVAEALMIDGMSRKTPWREPLNFTGKYIYRSRSSACAHIRMSFPAACVSAL